MSTTIIGRVAMLWRGDWTGTYEYDSLDVVAASDGNYYVSNGKNINKQPQSNPDMWSKMIDMSAVEAAKRAAQAAAGTAIEEARKIQPAIDNMETIVNGKVAELDTYGTKVAQLDKAISPYAKNIALNLTHNYATNKILAEEGDMVVLKAQPGWGITRIDREEFHDLGLASGDTLLLPMAHFDQEGKPTDNLMLVGAVLFAAEEAVKGQSGEVLYTRRTSLFRATDNAIATWGGVKKWLAIADNESLLICHPLDITSATITRNGNDAANAAADLNQRRRIEEKLNLGGKDPRAWVGMADQLAPSEKTEQAAYRDEVLPSGRILGFAPELGPSGAGTRDGQIADSVSPVMREVSGVSGGSGQMVTTPETEYKNGKTLDGRSTLNFMMVDSSGNNLSNAIITTTGAKAFIGKLTADSNYVRCKHNGNLNDFWFLGANSAWKKDERVMAIFDCNGVNPSVENGLSIINRSAINLTTLPQLPAPFVASLGQSDAHRVAHALGFLALQRD